MVTLTVWKVLALVGAGSLHTLVRLGWLLTAIYLPGTKMRQAGVWGA